MDTIKIIKQTAVSFFRSILPFSAGDNAGFKLWMTAKVGNEEKPLLLVGTAHSRVEDGHCIAVLNPDEDLVNKLHPCCAYDESILKLLVAKRCDAAVDVWIDAYKDDGVIVGTRYKNRNPQPAKFVVV